MDCTLQRFLTKPDGIFGRLLGPSQQQLAVTLEHAYPGGSDDWVPKVPSGSYQCTRYFSPKRQYVVWKLNNVPGHDYIEIHIGNYNEDSDGCILLGEFMHSDGRAMIADSRVAFNKFMALQEGVDAFQLVIQ